MEIVVLLSRRSTALEQFANNRIRRSDTKLSEFNRLLKTDLFRVAETERVSA